MPCMHDACAVHECAYRICGCLKQTRKEIEEERHEFATKIAASNISNQEFHRALAEFDREHEQHTW